MNRIFSQEFQLRSIFIGKKRQQQQQKEGPCQHGSSIQVRLWTEPSHYGIVLNALANPAGHFNPFVLTIERESVYIV